MPPDFNDVASGGGMLKLSCLRPFRQAVHQYLESLLLLNILSSNLRPYFRGWALADLHLLSAHGRECKLFR